MLTAGRVVVVGLRAAQLVDHRQIPLQIIGNPVEQQVLVHRPVRAALAGRAVVGDQDHQRVVGLPGFLQVVKQP
jgi:hypothetical protein